MNQLTKQEDIIMHLYAYGYTCLEISKELDISKEQVSLHISDIYRKLIAKEEQRKLIDIK